MANVPDDKPKKHKIIGHEFKNSPFVPLDGFPLVPGFNAIGQPVFNCRSVIRPIDNRHVRKTSEPWLPGRTVLTRMDVVNSAHGNAYALMRLSPPTMDGMLGAAALTADLIIRRIMKESKQ